jgi:hypothetical protein
MAYRVVDASELIETLAEARFYYASKLARTHTVTCKETRIDIVLEQDGTHLFSVEVEDINAIPADQLVTRNIGGGKREVRQFSLERARLMDKVLPAISDFTVCTSGKGAPSREPRIVHGPRLPCGRYMRVVLRPGPGTAWTCLSAFAIEEAVYRQAFNSKRAKFPP